MRRRPIRLVAGALVALCWAGCLTSVASANGGGTVAKAPALKLGATAHGVLFNSNFYSGYSATFWTAALHKGDHLSVRTTVGEGETPPCQIMYMPGTDDNNVGATTPVLEPILDSQTRDLNRDFQRWSTVPETGTYVLAMTNADIYLASPHQCLAAASGAPFTFKVSVARRGSSAGAAKQDKQDKQQTGKGSGSGSTRVVKSGQSLWVIAQGLVDDPFSIADVAFKVDRLWQLNAARIGTGNRDLIFPGQELRLR